MIKALPKQIDKTIYKLAFRVFTLISVILPVVFLQGCEQISYYGQAIQGHLAIMSSEQDIQQLIDSEETDPKLKERLKEVLSALDYAEQHLAMPQAETNYRSFVQLDRNYPVWSVVAAPDDSLSPRQWCYPFVGCASYRGYYSEQEANDYAQNIFKEGHMDIHVGGADAYSTLGWFNDPVLSTFFRRDEIGLHALIFHELAHQVLYLQGDSTFNESFASAVEETGIELWLKQQPELIERFHIRKERGHQFMTLLKTTRADLEEAYQNHETKEARLNKKRDIINQLTDRYNDLKNTHWNGYNGYDRWFEKPVNNARLALVNTYSQWVPAFKHWIKQCDYNYEAFYQAAETLSEQPLEERTRVLTLYDSAANPTLNDANKTDYPSLPCKYSPNS